MSKQGRGVSLEDQVMLRTTQISGLRTLLQEIGAGFIRLKDGYADFPLYPPPPPPPPPLSALKFLLDYDKQFYNPDLKELSVIDKNYGTKGAREN